MVSYYAVTPFDGISTKIEDSVPITYTVGSYAHKELPTLGVNLKTADGKPGVSFKAYNEPPTVKNREIADDIGKSSNAMDSLVQFS
jgi:beta-glucosidase